MATDFSTDKTKASCIEKEKHLYEISEKAFFYFKERHKDVRFVDCETPVAVAFDTKQKSQVFRGGYDRFTGKALVKVPQEVDLYHILLYYAFNEEKMRGDDRTIVKKLLKLDAEEMVFFEYGWNKARGEVNISSILGTPSYFFGVAAKCVNNILQMQGE